MINKKIIFFFLNIFCFIHSLAVPPTSYPYISTFTFRDKCHFALDEFGSFEPKDIKKTSIVYVGNDHLDRFFSEYHPKILVPYVLVSHNSDQFAPRQFVNYLNDPKIIKWFSCNPSITKHPKFEALPLGVVHNHPTLGNVSATYTQVLSEIKNKKKINKKFLLYINFKKENHPDRYKIYKKFSHFDWVHIEPEKNRLDYMRDLAKSDFVLSPRGVGLDCYRTWEALLVGAYPIVETSNLDGLFKDLPVVIVKNWSVVTKQFLIHKKKEFLQKKFDYKKIYAQYWLDKISLKNFERENVYEE